MLTIKQIQRPCKRITRNIIPRKREKREREIGSFRVLFVFQKTPDITLINLCVLEKLCAIVWSCELTQSRLICHFKVIFIFRLEQIGSSENHNFEMNMFNRKRESGNYLTIIKDSVLGLNSYGIIRRIFMCNMHCANMKDTSVIIVQDRKIENKYLSNF